jgi:hypothetical protein
MKKLNYLFIISIIGAVMFGTGCTKDGEQGPQGTAGVDGNANVKTEKIIIYGNEWGYSEPYYVVDKTSDLLTQDIVDNGSTHLYFEIEEGTWLALPYQTMGFGISVNSVGILTEGAEVIDATTVFKLVVIEGNIQSKAADVDFNDYNAVKEYYNLED